MMLNFASEHKLKIKSLISYSTFEMILGLQLYVILRTFIYVFFNSFKLRT